MTKGLATLPSETGGRASDDEGMDHRKGNSFQNVQEGLRSQEAVATCEAVG